MAYYECSSKEEPESIIISVIPFMQPNLMYGHLAYIYLYIDDTLIANYSSGGAYYFDRKSYTYTSPKSKKSVVINIIGDTAILVDQWYSPRSVKLDINGTIVSTLNSGGAYYIFGAIVYKYTFS